jgi:hypothetical protein
MSTPQSNTKLIGERHEVMGMNRAQLKAHNPSPIRRRSKQAHFREFS